MCGYSQNVGIQIVLIFSPCSHLKSLNYSWYIFTSLCALPYYTYFLFCKLGPAGILYFAKTSSPFTGSPATDAKTVEAPCRLCGAAQNLQLFHVRKIFCACNNIQYHWLTTVCAHYNFVIQSQIKQAKINVLVFGKSHNPCTNKYQTK